MERSYSGPVIDAFLHSPWLGDEDPADPRGDRVDWTGDPRLQRVMRTFHHDAAALISASDALRELDAAGVEGAILPAKVYYRATPREVRAVHAALAAFAAQTEGRLKTVATLVPPELGPATYWDAMENVRLVLEAWNEHAVVGVHLTPSPWGMPPNHKWLYPVYAKCCELGLAIFTYVGMPGPLWPMAPNDPTHLDEVALAFPELRIVAHHIGDPWTDMTVRLAARHPNFYICTSAWHPDAYPAALREFLAGRWHGTPGSRKIIFASDWPLLDLQQVTRAARDLPLTDEQQHDFLYGNAKRLFWD